MKHMRRREVEKALKGRGCTLDRSTGGHDVWRCPCGQHIAAVPRHNDIPAGTVRSIARSLPCLPKGFLG